MQIGSSNGNISSGNRSVLILVVIITISIIILFGILYFVKQRDLGEGAPGFLPGSPKIQIEKSSIKELIKLTTAPENNPDIKPNPVLTALTSATENNINTDSSLVERLTAPKN